MFIWASGIDLSTRHLLGEGGGGGGGGGDDNVINPTKTDFDKYTRSVTVFRFCFFFSGVSQRTNLFLLYGF